METQECLRLKITTRVSYVYRALIGAETQNAIGYYDNFLLILPFSLNHSEIAVHKSGISMEICKFTGRNKKMDAQETDGGMLELKRYVNTIAV